MTKKGPGRGSGSHLSAAGVALARTVGAEVGPVAYVLTSTVPRTLETAVAMGYAVDEAVEMPSGYIPGEVDKHAQWAWPEPYVAYARLLAAGAAGLAEVARAHQELWRRALAAVPDGGTALVVTHGGIAEPALVACFPDADHARWGGPLAPCDGARLTVDNGRFTRLEFRRAPTPC